MLDGLSIVNPAKPSPLLRIGFPRRKTLRAFHHWRFDDVPGIFRRLKVSAEVPLEELHPPAGSTRETGPAPRFRFSNKADHVSTQSSNDVLACLTLQRNGVLGQDLSIL